MTATEQLQAAGLRSTAQRRLVLELIAELRHATPDQLLAAAQERGESVDLSTIYRTLEVLDTHHLITHAHLGAGSPTYHAVDDRPHVHLVCRTCGKVTSIDASELTPMIDRVAEGTGFNVDVSHLALYGTCEECG